MSHTVFITYCTRVLALNKNRHCFEPCETFCIWQTTFTVRLIAGLNWRPHLAWRKILFTNQSVQSDLQTLTIPRFCAAWLLDDLQVRINRPTKKFYIIEFKKNKFKKSKFLLGQPTMELQYFRTFSFQCTSARWIVMLKRYIPTKKFKLKSISNWNKLDSSSNVNNFYIQRCISKSF